MDLVGRKLVVAHVFHKRLQQAADMAYPTGHSGVVGVDP